MIPEQPVDDPIVGGFAKLFGTLVLVVVTVCYADKRGW